MGEEKKLSSKTLKKVFNRHYQLLGCFNYERQMSTGYAWTMMPALKELYKDNPEEMKSAVKRHLEFYNCATTPSPFIIGISCAMEEQNASAEPGEYDPSSITFKFHFQLFCMRNSRCMYILETGVCRWDLSSQN